MNRMQKLSHTLKHKRKVEWGTTTYNCKFQVHSGEVDMHRYSANETKLLRTRAHYLADVILDRLTLRHGHTDESNMRFKGKTVICVRVRKAKSSSKRKKKNKKDLQTLPLRNVPPKNFLLCAHAEIILCATANLKSVNLCNTNFFVVVPVSYPFLFVLHFVYISIANKV